MNATTRRTAAFVRLVARAEKAEAELEQYHATIDVLEQTRHELTGERNKLKVAIDMGARAENERDAALREVKVLRQAIADEPEYPGDMPDEMWDELRNNRDTMIEALRLTAKLTKEGITARAEAELAKEEGKT